MSPPSGTRDEYSRKDGASGRVFRRGRGAIALSLRATASTRSEPPGTGPGPIRQLRFPRAVRPAVVVAAAIGAALLGVAEFTNLYGVHVVGRAAAVDVVTGGANNSYAMIPIAFLGIFLALAGVAGGGRLALASLALVGVVALLIGLLGDLPGAQQSAHLIRWNGKYVLGNSTPDAGMYMETLGAVLLLVAAGVGLLLGEPGGAQPGRPVGTPRHAIR